MKMTQKMWATKQIVDESSNSSCSGWQNNRQESIHSGHFMVSHFEAEDQDEDDTGIAMPDPDKSNTEIVLASDICTDICLPVPTTSTAIVKTTNTSVIDISLAKLFRCMNLAYKQKLTSPKWNRFKGVRLRWKDKIRLNNLIWRCWHMQFMMKKKTLVCQFASPLDVDIHSKPEAVVLEGKYWKRQFDVIKAEYMKWRKFYRHRGSGNHCNLDTVSELDPLDWSPANPDKILMGGIDDYFWTADTLFSTINNTPYPFPDPREIAKAGIADFIQPSLGPLQPNLDDFMNGIPFQELINSQFNSRLPSVPEEGNEDIFKTVDYDFPAIMGSESMDTSPIVNISSTTTSLPRSSPQQQQQHHQHNQHHLTMLNNTQQQQQINPIHYSAKIYGHHNINLNSASDQMSQQSQMNLSSIGSYSNSNSEQQQQQIQNTNIVDTIDHPKKRHLKERSILQSAGKQLGRRIPHNYDKSQPTPHQTIIYNQVIAQHSNSTGGSSGGSGGGGGGSAVVQHQQQQQQQQLLSASGYNNHPNAYTNVIQQMHPSPIIQTTTNNNFINSPNNALNLSNSMTNVIQMNTYSQSQLQQQQQNVPQQNSMNLLPQQQQHLSTAQQSPSLISLLSSKQEKSTPMEGIQHESYKSISNHQNIAYKPYPAQKIMKISSGASSYSQLSPTSHSSTTNLCDQTMQQMQQQQLQQQQLTDKEMYRSKSLPINASLQLPVHQQHQQQQQQQQLQQQQQQLQKDGAFAVPKFQPAKATRIRNRSNSLIVKQAIHPNAMKSALLSSSSILQSATSEPALSTLAQLLTTNSNMPQQHQSYATNQLSSAVQSQQQQQEQQQQQQHFMLQTQQSAPIASTSMTTANLIQKNAPSIPFMSASSSPLQPALSISPDLYDHDSPVSPTRTSPGSSSRYQRSGPLTSPGGSGDTQRRAGHIHAEQKRRYNIKNGFDMLHSLIPQLQQNVNAKLSKAAMLQKGAEYIKILRSERATINEKMEILKKERDSLNNSLNHLHSVLPANGAPISREKTGRVKELYEAYVRYRTLENWKFWILGLIFRPLFNSFNTTVSVASMEELSRTSILWVDQHCSLIEMRPAVSNQLRYLSTTTDILSDPPSSLQDEVLKAIS